MFLEPGALQQATATAAAAVKVLIDQIEVAVIAVELQVEYIKKEG